MTANNDTFLEMRLKMIAEKKALTDSYESEIKMINGKLNGARTDIYNLVQSIKSETDLEDLKIATSVAYATEYYYGEEAPVSSAVSDKRYLPKQLTDKQLCAITGRKYTNWMRVKAFFSNT